MKFCFTISIAIYFLCNFWRVILVTCATKEENTKIITNLNSIMKPKIEEDKDFQLAVHRFRLLHSINKNIRCLILNQLLTIRDILILRQTCKDLKFLIFPNDRKMVMFGEDFCSKKMTEVPLIWFALKYFLNQSYANAFEKMEIFKENRFNRKGNQHAIFTRTLDKKIIMWHNDETPYPAKIILEKSKNESIENNRESMLQYNPPKIWTQDETAWAKITNEGDVITGLDTLNGGDSSNVQSQLKNVKMIVSTGNAFSALLKNGHVVAWGDEEDGGKIPDEIQTQLENVKFIFATYGAFAALLGNGGVVAWGDEDYGGIIFDETQTQLQNVKMIFSNLYAFAALLDDGSVFAWGHEDFGGEIPSDIQTKLMKTVKMVSSTLCGFAALLNDGHVITWGHEPYLGGELKNIKKIFTNFYAFTALTNDGCAIAWGNEDYGGKIPKIIQNTKKIFSTLGAFAALLNDNSVVAWGDESVGGKIPADIQNKLYQNVKKIVSSDCAFAALLIDGGVVAWGDELYGVIPEFIQNKLQNVQMVFSTECSFAALLQDGSVFSWGHEYHGGKIPVDIQTKLNKNVKFIFPNRFNFTALCKNGELIQWGEN